MASPRPWPKLREEDEWLVDLMDERFARTNKTPAQLRARAEELRAEAAETGMHGIREATLALADRYEQASVRRLTEH